MAIIKCKMCGGDVEIAPDKTFGTCEYCGSTMTFPRVDDDQRAAAFNRGNHFRRIGEFDKALQVYERIVREDENDAEAHWCCALCRFGIEYVEDPASFEYIPTCHRASFDNFLEDVDYLAAVEHSDGITRRQYQKDGAKIAEVQRGILATSQNEEPYDVFICYKETDENGDRTRDSAMAQDIYYQLTEQGRRVFFARISLEDKVGAEFEPYIFAALHSAKVMVVVGTSAENLNAVWVKNEWSRFLAMMKHDRNKILLPCYRDMDPYDLPEQLSVLQSYDMGKIGFIQDLTRGISKVLDAEVKPEPVKETVMVQQTGTVEIAPLLKRAFMFLEDGNWDSADEYCERVLDMDPECAEAYVGKLMASLHVKKQEKLKDVSEPFDDRNTYDKAVRFADDALKNELTDCNTFIRNRNEQARLEGIYCKAKKAMQSGKTESDYKSVASQFQSVSSYKDAAILAKKCLELAEIARKDAVYDAARTKMIGGKVNPYEKAIQELQTILGWKDADQQIEICQNKIQKILEKEKQQVEFRRKQEEKAKKKKQKRVIIVAAFICICFMFLILLHVFIIPAQKFKKAQVFIESGDYVTAYELLYGLNYKDSEEKMQEIYSKYFLQMIQIGDEVYFGVYEQDNNFDNGKEEIVWQVLDKQGGKILVITKYAIDCKPYHTETKNITWESCSLRKWLNNDFMNTAFTSEEKNLIANVEVLAEKNTMYDTNQGNDTQDSVFLLSVEEVRKYFSSYNARICKATPYAYDNNAYKSDNGSCWWWLRSIGRDQNTAACILTGGSIYFTNDVNKDNNAVRPAMWIDLES